MSLLRAMRRKRDRRRKTPATWERVLTHTLATTFLSCPRRAYWRYVRRLKTASVAAPLALGSAIHSALDIWATNRQYNGLSAPPPPVEDVTPIGLNPDLRPLFEAMYVAYANRWQHDGLEVTHVEQDFVFPMEHMGGGGRTWWKVAGKIDRVVKIGGESWILETKTTSSVESAYLTRLWLDTQIRLYAYAAQEALETTAAGVIYDVLLKPSLRQRKGEAHRDFCSRLTARCSEPESLLRTNILLPAGYQFDIKGWLFDVSRLITNCANNDRWPMNTSACFNHYGRRCPYHPICSSLKPELVIQEGYIERDPYEELLDDEDPAQGATPAAQGPGGPDGTGLGAPQGGEVHLGGVDP